MGVILCCSVSELTFPALLCQLSLELSLLRSPVLTFSLILGTKIITQPQTCLLCIEAVWKQERRVDRFGCSDLSGVVIGCITQRLQSLESQVRRKARNMTWILAHVYTRRGLVFHLEHKPLILNYYKLWSSYRGRLFVSHSLCFYLVKKIHEPCSSHFLLHLSCLHSLRVLASADWPFQTWQQ